MEHSSLKHIYFIVFSSCKSLSSRVYIIIIKARETNLKLGNNGFGTKPYIAIM